MKIEPVPQEVLNHYDDMISPFESRILNDFDLEDPETVVAGASLKHIRWMLKEIPQLEDYSKQHRWLGFIQGLLCKGGFTTVLAERDFTRPYFTKKD